MLFTDVACLQAGPPSRALRLGLLALGVNEQAGRVPALVIC